MNRHSNSARFLLAAAHVSYVLQQVSISTVKKSLHQLPPNLTKTYEKWLSRIRVLGPELERLAFTTFAWILYSFRPLTTCEILEALAVEEASMDQDPDHLIEITTVLDCCNGFIAVDTGSDVVRFSHFTVHEFLFEHREVFPAPLFIAKTCLSYILFDRVSKSELVDRVIDRVIDRVETKDFQFLRYAAEYCLAHIKTAGSDDWISARLEELLATNWKYEPFLRLLSISGRSLPTGLDNFDPLRLVAWAGLDFAVGSILDRSWTISCELNDASGVTALHAACIGGDTPTIRRILQWNPTSINLQDTMGRTALHYAAERGHAEAMKVLFEFHANPKLLDQQDRDPLHTALAWREEEAAKIIFDRLMDEEVDVHRRADGGHFGWYTDGYTLLHHAALLGYDRAIEWLLEAGADPAQQTSRGLTPLYFAARHGHTAAVAVLLAATNNVVRPSDLRDTPLHQAAKFGRLETVHLLLTSNPSSANINDLFGYKPIHWAAAGGFEKVVEALLPSAGFECSVSEMVAPSPLQLASWGGHSNVCALLVRQHELEHVPPPEFDAIRKLVLHYRDVILDPHFKYPLPPKYHVGITLCHYYGFVCIRAGYLASASAWLDVGLLLNPENSSIIDPKDIIFPRKVCDNCNMRRIRGPSYTCLECWAPCFDLCAGCFALRVKIGHHHNKFLRCPASSAPLPSFEEHLDRLKLALESEVPTWANAS
jgi:ankyrin repeat protein